MNEGLIDVSLLGTVVQRPLSSSFWPKQMQFLSSLGHPNDSRSDIKGDGQPFWRLDLAWPIPIQRVVVASKADSRFELRGRGLVLELSQDGQDWVVVFTDGSRLEVGKESEPIQIELGGRIIARHVRLSLPDGQVIQPKKVGVLANVESFELLDKWLNLGFDCGKVDSAHSMPWVNYRIVNIGDRQKEVSGLIVKDFGRFGNAVVQLQNAVYLAKQKRLSFVRAPGVSIRGHNLEVEKSGVRLLPKVASLPDGSYLEGDFFYHHRISSSYFSGLGGVERRQIALDYLGPFFGIGPLDPSKLSAQHRELAIHIRSGDIFGPDPHRLYVQPPLSFYRKITLDRMDAGLVDRVCIVCEDRINPCIDALEAELILRGVPVRVQSGSLLDDIDYLRHARHVVYGEGTFGYGISTLAADIHTLAVFGRKGRYAELPNVRRVEFFGPVKGTYIEPGFWTASPEQRRLMIEFPEDKIQIS